MVRHSMTPHRPPTSPNMPSSAPTPITETTHPFQKLVRSCDCDTTRRALKFDHAPESVTTRAVRVCASSKAKMMRGSFSFVLGIFCACDLVLEPSVLVTKVGDAWCSLACKASSSLQQATEGVKLYSLLLECEGEE